MSPKNIWKSIEKDKNSPTQKIVHLSESITESLGCLEETIQKSLQCLRSRSVADFLGQYTVKLYKNPQIQVFLMILLKICYTEYLDRLI